MEYVTTIEHELIQFLTYRPFRPQSKRVIAIQANHVNPRHGRQQHQPNQKG